jgi:ABC-type sugar transport system substrate-binding protein
MERTISPPKHFAVTTLCACALIALTACGTTNGSANSGNTAGHDPAKDLIQVLQPGVHPYVAAGNKGASAAAQRLGLTNVRTTQSNFDPTTEVSNLQNAIAANAKAIVQQAASSTGIMPGVNSAVGKGICYVAITAGPGTTTQELFPGIKGYVGWNEYQNGQLMGAALAKGMGGTGNVVVIQGVLDNDASKERQSGAEAVWKKDYPGIKVIGMQAAQYDSDKARNAMQNFIQQFGTQINGVLSITNNMATAAADVIEASPLKGKVSVVSTGGQQQFIDYIKAGKVYATTPELPVSEATTGLQLADECLKGDKVPRFVNEIDLPAVAALKNEGYVVDATNVDQFKPEW